jgi:hypothetical protein
MKNFRNLKVDKYSNTYKYSNMQSENSKRGRPKGSKTRYAGIAADADALGVTPNHLWKVATLRRESPGLLRRYEELQRQKRQAVPAKTANRNRRTTKTI